MELRRCTRILLAVSIPLLGGCFKSYVAVTFASEATDERRAEVVSTPRFDTLRGGVKVVAVRAPAACGDESSAQDREAAAGGAGLAARGRAILETRCAVFLSEIERALSRRYRVVGWRETAAEERKSGFLALSPASAPADIVLVVTDLAPTPLFVSDFSGAAVRLIDAAPEGTPRSAEPVPKGGERFIRRFLAERYPDGILVGVKMRLEVIAFSAATKEPLWSYRRRLADDLKGAQDVRVLLRGRGHTWRPVEPRRRAPSSASGNGRSSPVQARLQGLAASLADDLAERFSGSP